MAHGHTQVLLPTERNLCADDLALLVLDEPVSPFVAVPAVMSLHRDLATSPPDQVAVVGRGVTSETLDLTTFDLTSVDGGLRRRFVQHIPSHCASDTATACTVLDYSSPPTNSFTAPSSYFVIGSGTASGDSGSGVLAQTNFGPLPRVLGVTSAGTYDAMGHPNFGLISRLDTHRDFILGGLRTAAHACGHDLDAFAGQAD